MIVFFFFFKILPQNMEIEKFFLTNRRGISKQKKKKNYIGINLPRITGWELYIFLFFKTFFFFFLVFALGYNFGISVFICLFLFLFASTSQKCGQLIHSLKYFHPIEIRMRKERKTSSAHKRNILFSILYLRYSCWYIKM